MKKTLMILAMGLIFSFAFNGVALATESPIVTKTECKDGDGKKACCKKDGEKKEDCSAEKKEACAKNKADANTKSDAKACCAKKETAQVEIKKAACCASKK